MFAEDIPADMRRIKCERGRAIGNENLTKSEEQDDGDTVFANPYGQCKK